MSELFTTLVYFICCLHSNKVYRFITLLLLFYVLFLFESYNIWLLTTKPYMDVEDKFPRNSKLKYILNPLTMIPITGITGFLTVYFLWGLFNKILIVLFRSLTLIISFMTLLCLKNKNAAPLISIAILIISGFDIFYLKRAEISIILFTLSMFPVLNKFLRNSLTLKLVYFELFLYKGLRDFINRELKSKNWGRYACNYFANEIVVINTKVICSCKIGKQDILPDNINNLYEINGGLVRILENSNNFTVVFENTGKESYTFNTRNKGELVKSKLLTSLHFWRENPNLGIFDENPKVTAALEDIKYIVAHCISPEDYKYFINNDNVKFSVENLISNHPYLVLGKEKKKKGGMISETVNSSENSLYMSKMFGLNPDLSNIIEEYSSEFKKDCGAGEIAIMLIKSKTVLFKPVCFRNSEFKLFCSDLNRLLGLMILKGKRGGSKFISNCSVMKPSLVCEKFINEIKSKGVKQYIRSLTENCGSYKKSFKDRNLEKNRRLTVDLKRPEIEKEETEVSVIKEAFNLIMDPKKGIKKLIYSCSTNFTSVEIGERPTGETMDQETMKELLSETEGLAKFRYDQILKRANSGKGNRSKSGLSDKSIEFLRNHENKVKKINDSREISYKLGKWEREKSFKSIEREREIRSFCESKKSELSFNFYKKTFKRISGDRTVSFETLKDSALKLKNQFEVLDLVNENGDLSLIEDVIAERKKKILDRREKTLGKKNKEEGRMKGKGEGKGNVIPEEGKGEGKGSETTEVKISDKNKNKNETPKGIDTNYLIRNHFKDNEGLVSKVKEDFVNKICKRRCRKVNSILRSATLSEIIKSLINRERTIKPNNVNKIGIKITSSIWKEWDLKPVFVRDNDGDYCEIKEILNKFYREYLRDVQVYFEMKSLKLIKKYGMI